ncbi:hypothetical protein BG842_17710 [Haladaptatus sp. W1]|nr:hypothetical protein BG842_17710 [Haladaptatus sp. W1]
MLAAATVEFFVDLRGPNREPTDRTSADGAVRLLTTSSASLGAYHGRHRTGGHERCSRKRPVSL